ncbi:hypothetical protein F4777DRAFT_574864 [Nemania sp. FL0916]|nr:hypothetical protein F4777DRAFT_574864 [Nemania sp. FL0916]
MEPMYGLHEVAGPRSKDSMDDIVDLVAIHGLGGHALGTWTDKRSGTCWIRDHLHYHIPNVRIMTFGYNAKRTSHNADIDFRDVSTQLLAGVVFFATPHCGSRFANLAVVLETFSKLILDTPSNFFRDLSTNAVELKELNSLFIKFLDLTKVPCITFYEGFKTKRFLKSAIVRASYPQDEHILTSRKIVTRESAVLDVENEDAICLNANHSDIVRLRSTDNNFQIVIEKLKNLVQHITCHLNNPENHQRSEVYVPFFPGKYFVGRSMEVGKLKHWYFGDSQEPTNVIALCGQSGVGKTQIALKYANDNQASYKYIFFVNASSHSVLRNELLKLRPLVNMPEKSDDAVADMISWLLKTSHCWLLILDNADDLEDIMPTVARLATASGHTLLTTQDMRIRDKEFVSQSLKVDMLSQEESKQLLFSRAGIVHPRPEDVQIAQNLVDELGCLPLAIDSAGAYINSREKSIQEYSDLFHKYQKDVLSHRPRATSYERSVLGSLELNFQRIDLCPDASTLLTLLVFLDRAEITEEFLRRGASKQDRWAPNGELMQVAPRYIPQELIDLINNDIRLDQAVEDLTALSILSYQNRSTAGRSFSIHPLYHNCAKLRMEREQRRKNSAIALLFLAHAFPVFKVSIGKVEADLARSYLHHLHYCYESFQDHTNNLGMEYLDNLAASENTSAPTPRDLITRLVMEAVAIIRGDETQILEEFGWGGELIKKTKDTCLWTEAIELGVLQVSIAEHLVTELPVNTNFKNNIAIIRSWRPLNPESPSTREKVTLGIQCRALGKLFKDRGDLEEGMKEFYRYLSTYAVQGRSEEGWVAEAMTAEQCRSDRSGDTMYLEVLLCETFLLQGRITECEAHLQDLLDRLCNFESLFHVDAFQIFIVQATLARLRQMDGRYSEALAYWRAALDTCVTELDTGQRKGKWSRNTFFPSVVLLSMAHCLQELGETKEGDMLCVEAEQNLQATAPHTWALALGTYWLSWVRARVEMSQTSVGDNVTEDNSGP